MELFPSISVILPTLYAYSRTWPLVIIFFFYSCLIIDIHVRFPLNEFTTDVLRALNVMSTQLHPNSWAYIQTFRLLCLLLHLRPTLQVFLQMYSIRHGNWVRWFSWPRSCLLAPLLFLIRILGGVSLRSWSGRGCHLFYDGDAPRFPLYLTRKPPRFRVWPRSSLTR